MTSLAEFVANDLADALVELLGFGAWLVERPEVVECGVETLPIAADVSPHTLRHSVAYRIIQVNGGRLEDVQLRLRHANRRTTDRIYSYFVPR